MDEQFIAGLLGALVGGIASFVGSVVVNRRELMRAARVRLHDELLPALEAAIDAWGMNAAMSELRRSGPHPPGFEDLMAATKRAAVLAGKSAVAKAEAIESAHRALRERHKDPVFNPRFGTYDDDPEDTARRSVVVERIQDLAGWVEGKIL